MLTSVIEVRSISSTEHCAVEFRFENPGVKTCGGRWDRRARFDRLNVHAT
jgi:hypothetical protein